jgi:predicted anti-sigma-YlaC factor YlaD
VDCDEVGARLFAGDAGDDELLAHAGACPGCRLMAARVAQLDAVLSASLLETPPLVLQQRLLALAQPTPIASWREALALLLTRPHATLAHAFAAICVVLAGWQVFVWLSGVGAVVGDIPYALQLLASSPALTYLGGVQTDAPALAAWSAVGVAAWSVSESGPLHELVFGPRGETA